MQEERLILHTTLPVIGVPIESNIAGGLDSILSILQMPSGIPVATMPAGKAGGANAALFALNILSVSDKKIEEKLISYREEMKSKIDEKNTRMAEVGLQGYIDEIEAKK